MIRLKRMNKKGWFDDFFDFLFTVVSAFFVLMFMGMILVASTDRVAKELKNHVTIVQDTDDFLVLERSQLEKGYYLKDLDSRYTSIKRYGSIERQIKEKRDFYADNPYVAGVDSDGDPIPIVG